MLKIQRNFGQWLEIRDQRSGLQTRVRVVPSNEHGKVQFEFVAPPEVKIDRVKPEERVQRA